MSGIIKLRLYDYDVLNSEDHPTLDGDECRYIDTQPGWQAFREHARDLVPEIMRYWNFFDSYEVAFTFDEKTREGLCAAVGQIRFGPEAETETAWLELVEYCLKKGTHEQFDEATLHDDDEQSIIVAAKLVV